MAHAPNPGPVEHAKVLISERRYQDAVRSCRRALLSRPTDVALRLLLAEALLALERYDEVRVEMLGLQRKSPERAEVHRILGEAYLRAGRTEPAVEALRRAVELDPNDEVAKELIAEANKEKPPPSGTVERWFDETHPTAPVAEVPDFEDDVTIVPASLTAEPEAKPSPFEPPTAKSGRPAARPPSARVPIEPRATPPPGPRPDLPRESTQAARPSAKRAQPAFQHDVEAEHMTIADDDDSEEFTQVDYLETGFHDPPSVESVDDTTTAAFGRAAADVQRFAAAAAQTPAPSPPTARAPAPQPIVHQQEMLRSRPAPAPTLVPAPVATPLAPEPVATPPPAQPVPVVSVRPAPPRPNASRGRAIGAAVGVVFALALVVAVAVVLVTMWSSSTELQETRAHARTAVIRGDRAALEAVLAELGSADEPPERALRARLLATLLFEYGAEGDPVGEGSTLAELLEDPAVRDHTDARIAAALRSLHDGDASDALTSLSGLTAEDEQIAEAFRARALATGALGRYAEADEAARQAVSAEPGSARHLTLHAWMRYLSGNAEGALTLLDGIGEGADDPAVQITRARILLERNEAPERVREAALAVIGMPDRASSYDVARAHLLLAVLALRAAEDASTHLDAARLAIPPLDETFSIRLAETLLTAGEVSEAAEVVAGWPAPPIDEARRARLAAGVYFANGRIDDAERALVAAPDELVTRILRGQVRVARGDTATARGLFEAGIETTGRERWLARTELARVELVEGNAERAVALLEPGRESEANDPSLVSTLARAYLKVDRTDEAGEIVDVALARRPGEGELLAARGAVLLARGMVEPALESMRQARERRPYDPDLATDLGNAARIAGQIGDARQSFEAALARRAEHPGAVLGLASLALLAGDMVETETLLVRAEAAHAPVNDVARVRADLAVRRGDGQAGVEAVHAVLSRAPRDLELVLRLGDLYRQAERDTDASHAYRRALELDRDSPDAWLGQAYLDVRRGSLATARTAIDRGERVAAERGRAGELGAPVAVARALMAFEIADFERARASAQEALEIDQTYGPAHLVLANVALERGENPVLHLRAAAEGHHPPPEAVGRLAVTLRTGDEACRMAARYLVVAPSGYDADDVERVASACD